mmetsp:Transcript_17590/g.56819  ORF Transcript_17590/g.56819 Transcript_17590/m.56819 type:complete len:397 (-) Transcript_17590:8517-9707(-)
MLRSCQVTVEEAWSVSPGEVITAQGVVQVVDFGAEHHVRADANGESVVPFVIRRLREVRGGLRGEGDDVMALRPHTLRVSSDVDDEGAIRCAEGVCGAAAHDRGGPSERPLNNTEIDYEYGRLVRGRLVVPVLIPSLDCKVVRLIDARVAECDPIRRRDHYRGGAVGRPRLHPELVGGGAEGLPVENDVKIVEIVDKSRELEVDREIDAEGPLKVIIARGPRQALDPLLADLEAGRADPVGGPGAARPLPPDEHGRAGNIVGRVGEDHTPHGLAVREPAARGGPRLKSFSEVNFNHVDPPLDIELLGVAEVVAQLNGHLLLDAGFNHNIIPALLQPPPPHHFLRAHAHGAPPWDGPAGALQRALCLEARRQERALGAIVVRAHKARKQVDGVVIPP